MRSGARPKWCFKWPNSRSTAPRPAYSARNRWVSAGDARHQAACALARRQDDLLALHASERDYRVAVPGFAFVVDAGVVVALVHRARLWPEAASVQRVEERSGVKRAVAAGSLYLPRERQAGGGADSGVQLETEERACRSCRASGAMPPRRIAVGEPHALRPVFADRAVAVRPRVQVRGVNRHVRADTGVLGLQGRGDPSRQSARSGLFSRSFRANL